MHGLPTSDEGSPHPSDARCTLDEAVQDRSLGTTELKMSDLAKDVADQRYPFASLGKKTAVDPLRLDKGNTHKGNLHYVAEFVPCLKLKGITFDSQPTEISKVISGNNADKSSRSSMESSSRMAPETPVSANTQVGINVSANEMKLSDISGTAAKSESAPENSEEVEEGVEMSLEELLKHRRFSRLTAMRYPQHTSRIWHNYI